MGDRNDLGQIGRIEAVPADDRRGLGSDAASPGLPPKPVTELDFRSGARERNQKDPAKEDRGIRLLEYGPIAEVWSPIAPDTLHKLGSMEVAQPDRSDIAHYLCVAVHAETVVEIGEIPLAQKEAGGFEGRQHLDGAAQLATTPPSTTMVWPLI